MLDVSILQAGVGRWNNHNFPDATDEKMFMGVAEEVGELAHALLKQKQGIRQNEDHEAKAQDAVGDICIYLMALCEKRGWSFGDCIARAWAEVKGRDWTKERAIAAESPQLKEVEMSESDVREGE